jgi:hypothetical protein
VQPITYAETLDCKTLQQGDVLARTPEIDEVLEQVHPHYTKDDYRFLMVLTQTCDLVRRYGDDQKKCKSRYISVAAVRPLELVISREVARLQRSPLESAHRLCDAKHREKIAQFLERLLNNNEEEYFYLHPYQVSESVAGLTEAHCAFLALSIALKSELHYDTCLNAKIIQLDDSFQHKLGWLTGKMYSRVGTADWVPDGCTAQQFEAHVGRLLDDACVWIDPLLRPKLLKKLKEVPENERTTDRVLQEYGAIKATAPKKKDLLVDRLGEILKEQEIDEAVVKRIKNLVMSDSDIAADIAK